MTPPDPQLRRRVRNRLTNDDGSATMELAIMAVGIFACFMLVSYAWRVQQTIGAVSDAAAEAARAASLRNPAEFASAAQDAANESLSTISFLCGARSITTAGGSGAVTVTVKCEVPLSDLTLIGVSGTQTIEATETEVVDRFRGGD